MQQTNQTLTKPHYHDPSVQVAGQVGCPWLQVITDMGEKLVQFLPKTNNRDFHKGDISKQKQQKAHLTVTCTPDAVSVEACEEVPVSTSSL